MTPEKLVLEELRRGTHNRRARVADGNRGRCHGDAPRGVFRTPPTCADYLEVTGSHISTGSKELELLGGGMESSNLTRCTAGFAPASPSWW
jgi:hypothetical protein